MLLAGCDYEIPLSLTPSAPANPALAGKWNEQSTGGNPASIEIKISAKSYDVVYTNEGKALTFKGLAIKAAGLNMVQLEWQEPDAAESKNKYLFAKYELTTNSLFIYCLNPNVVSAKCQTTEEMLSDLSTHRNNPFLFKEPMIFIRSVQQ